MRTHLVTGILLCAAAVSGLAAQKPQKPASDIPVTTIISDYDTGISTALQLQSDQAGAYTHSQSLTSLVTSTGFWVLNSLDPRNATRTVSLQFSRPIAGSGPGGGAPIAPASGNYQAHVYSSCNHPNYLSDYRLLPPGQTMPCPMAIRFEAAGKTYLIHMNDRAEFSETNHVDVTCIFPTTGGNPCSQWLIRPSGTFVTPEGTTERRNIVRLSEQVTQKGQTVFIKQGNFYMSFAIVITNP